MGRWVTVAMTDQIPHGGSRAVPNGPSSIAIFNIDGDLYAIDNECPHAGGPLSRGEVKDFVVHCPWHEWTFPLGLENPPDDGLKRYPVRIEGDNVQVELPED